MNLIEANGAAFAEALNNITRERNALAAELAALRDAARRHRDQHGDDRCWRDDRDLYATMPEGYTPPTEDSAVELERCRKFIASRQDPATTYVSPQREIERLQAELAALRAARRWVPVGERLPKGGGDFYTWDGRGLSVSTWHDGRWWTQNGIRTIDVTHWTTLPGGPEAP